MQAASPASTQGKQRTTRCQVDAVPYRPGQRHTCHHSPPTRRALSFMPLSRLTSDGRVVGADEPRHRDPSRSWRSSFEWQIARREQIARSPRCAICGATSRLTADHITPVAHGGAKFDPANLQTLCLTHNSAKGAQ